MTDAPAALVDEDGDLRCPTCSTTDVVRITEATDIERVSWDFKYAILEAVKSYDFEVSSTRYRCDNIACETGELTFDDEPESPTWPPIDPEPFTCRFCSHDIHRQGDTWIALDATGDDDIWRNSCPDNDTERAAPHEPLAEQLPAV